MAKLYEFTPFRLDAEQRVLLRDGVPVSIPPKELDTLLVLVESHGRVVEKQALLDRVWPGVFIEEGNLARHISYLRRRLGEPPAGGEYIETIPKRGYRFVADVRVLDAVSPDGAPDPAAAAAAAPAMTPSHEASSPRTMPWVPLAGVAAMVAIAIWIFRDETPSSVAAAPESRWEQITSFADSAVQPAISPDGKLIAFIRGQKTFVSAGQIYVKPLAGGDPVQLTNDNVEKMSPAFSPDGAQIAYTTPWDTYTVPVLGGAARRMLANASGLFWSAKDEVTYSAVKQGSHMGLVRSRTDGSAQTDIYFPPGEHGMAHRSALSPDGKWIVSVEMDVHQWLPCRILAATPGAKPQPVGPPTGGCTHAAWSPDGKWIYLTVDVGDGFHIWRQQFPNGRAEQITFGPTEQEGVAFLPDGRSFITSAGLRHSSVWIERAGERRQISVEGFASITGLGFGGGSYSAFSPDGKQLYYLVASRSQSQRAGELTIVDLESGRSRRLFSGFLMTSFQISPDGKRIAFSAADASGAPRLWVAPVDGSLPPRMLGDFKGRTPFFTPAGDIVFSRMRDNTRYIARMTGDGNDLGELSSMPINFLEALSPDGEWAVAVLGEPGHTDGVAIMAFPTTGKEPVPICRHCDMGWSPDGKYAYLRFRETAGENGRAYALPTLVPGGLPKLPAKGILNEGEMKSLPVVWSADVSEMTYFSPGPKPGYFAFAKSDARRNLYRVPLE